jgi:hypothetical protein
MQPSAVRPRRDPTKQPHPNRACNKESSKSVTNFANKKQKTRILDLEHKTSLHASDQYAHRLVRAWSRHRHSEPQSQQQPKRSLKTRRGQGQKSKQVTLHLHPDEAQVHQTTNTSRVHPRNMPHHRHQQLRRMQGEETTKL